MSSPQKTENESAPSEILLAVVMGISATILFFTVFLICAQRWDRWITRKLATRTVYITQHFDQEGSSHLSEIIVRNENSLVSNSMMDESDESSVDEYWYNRMVAELFNFERGCGNNCFSSGGVVIDPTRWDLEYENTPLETFTTPDSPSVKQGSNTDDIRELLNITADSLNSDYSSITDGSSYGNSSEDEVSSDDETVKIKNSSSQSLNSSILIRQAGINDNASLDDESLFHEVNYIVDKGSEMEV